MRIQNMEDSILVVNWLNGKWKISNPKFRAEVQKDAEPDGQDRQTYNRGVIILTCFSTFTGIGIRELIILHVWQGEKGASWNSLKMNERDRLEAVRAYFDEGVSRQDDGNVKHEVGSVYVIQSSERIEEHAEKMSWKTIVEVAQILPDDATIAFAESTAAVEAARAICGPARTGRICFDFDGNLFENWDENGTRRGNKMKERYGR